MNQQEDRREILDLVKKYYYNYLKKNDEFKPLDRVSYAGRFFDEQEVCNLVESALDFWLTSGKYCEMFERKFAQYLSVRYVSLTNSGSSANLLAFSALTSPLLKERQIRREDEVITVAASFPTTVTPIINYGAVPVFLDIDIPTYNIDISLLEKALSSKTKAVMIAHTLGNPFNIKAVTEFCKKYNLWLIEDNCDALGSVYEVNGLKKKTGTFGDIGTSSFYPPHHITMGEGGAVYTNNALLHKIIVSFRDWGRDCICNSGEDNLCGRRFEGQFGELPVGYDHKYVYSHFGYNLKATEMQAAIGVAQLDKLEVITKRRRENFEYLKNGLIGLKEYLILPEATLHSNPSWFGFLITVKEGVDRNALVKFIESHNIQTRLLFASNMILHPCFNQMRLEGKGYRVVGDLENTNIVLERTFWIGLAPTIDAERLNYMISIINEYFNIKHF